MGHVCKYALSFNEAEASLPRNPEFGAEQKLDSACFNEAEASLPRNRAPSPRHCPDRCPASMRPRQACLGIGVKITIPGEPFFASMRPRQACLGIIEVRHKYTRIPELASMRPRQACLGIALHGAEPVLPALASMRPRQACLGIRGSERQTTGQTKLQ